MQSSNADRMPTKRAVNKMILMVLRFLAGAGTGGAAVDQKQESAMPPEAVTRASKEPNLRLLRDDGRKLLVTKHMLAHLMKSGAVMCKADAYHLSREGRAALKRLLVGDGSTFGDQHRELEWRSDGDGGSVKVNLAESPLGGLSRLKQRDGSMWFSSDMIAAGDRLRGDFTRGHYQPGMGVRFDNVAGSGSTARGAGIAELTDAAMAARLRMEKALVAVGPELAGPLVDVCCYLKGLEMVESERQWPRRSAKLMLRAGLERLARHYRPTGGTTCKKSRSWGSSGYRPDLSGSQTSPGQGCD